MEFANSMTTWYWILLILVAVESVDHLNAICKEYSQKRLLFVLAHPDDESMFMVDLELIS